MVLRPGEAFQRSAAKLAGPSVREIDVSASTLLLSLVIA